MRELVIEKEKEYIKKLVINLFPVRNIFISYVEGRFKVKKRSRYIQRHEKKLPLKIYFRKKITRICLPRLAQQPSFKHRGP